TIGVGGKKMRARRLRAQHKMVSDVSAILGRDFHASLALLPGYDALMLPDRRSVRRGQTRMRGDGTLRNQKSAVRLKDSNMVCWQAVPGESLAKLPTRQHFVT